jgi:hypothetical protein
MDAELAGSPSGYSEKVISVTNFASRDWNETEALYNCKLNLPSDLHWQ